LKEVAGSGEEKLEEELGRVFMQDGDVVHNMMV